MMNLKNKTLREAKKATPAEIEAVFQERREKEGFVDKVEENTIRNAVRDGKMRRNGRKVTLYIPVYYIHIPKWEREVRMDEVRKIANHYDENIFGYPKVILSNGKLICVDGQHRLAGCFFGGIEYVEVELLEDVTEEEARTIFIEQSKRCSNMTPSDKFGASVANEDPTYVALRDICARYNIQVKGSDVKLENPIGRICSISEPLAIIKKSPELFERILGMIEELQWNGVENAYAYGSTVMRVMKKLYAYYWNDLDLMEEILLEKCKGAEYCSAVMKPLKAAALFDMFSITIDDAIENGMAPKAKRRSKISKRRFTSAPISENLNIEEPVA